MTPRLPLRRKLRLGLEIVWLYGRVRWLMLRRQAPEVLGEVRGEVADRHEEGAAVALGRRLAQPVVRTLTVLPMDSRCLVRSLVLSGLLARRGVSSAVVIGVRTEPEFHAHAWVEHRGRPLLPTEDSYEPLTRL